MWIVIGVYFLVIVLMIAGRQKDWNGYVLGCLGIYVFVYKWWKEKCKERNDQSKLHRRFGPK